MEWLLQNQVWTDKLSFHTVASLVTSYHAVLTVAHACNLIAEWLNQEDHWDFNGSLT